MDVITAAATFGTVAALCVQLGSGVLKLQKIVESIKSAPAEIKDLHGDLGLFRALLIEIALVAGRQDSSKHTPASPQVLSQALKNCEAKLIRLHQHFAEYDASCSKSQRSKTWARL